MIPHIHVTKNWPIYGLRFGVQWTGRILLLHLFGVLIQFGRKSSFGTGKFVSIIFPT